MEFCGVVIFHHVISSFSVDNTCEMNSSCHCVTYEKHVAQDIYDHWSSGIRYVVKIGLWYTKY